MSLVRGCAGIALHGRLADQFSPLRCEPLASAQVQEVTDLDLDVGSAGLEPVWSLDAGAGVRWDLTARRDGEGLVFAVDGVPALVVDPGRSSIRVSRRVAAIAAQLVAAVAAPALAASCGAMPLHGAAAARGGAATVVLGPSGAGKSTVLRALVDDGWSPLAEDVSVIELRGDGAARTWPGPPWLRLGVGEAGPLAATTRPDPTGKVRWDLSDRMPDVPAALARIVLLAAPGPPTSAPRVEPVAPADAIASLPPHVTWLSALPRDAASFPAAVALGRRVPVLRLRLPRRPDWADLAVEVLAQP